MRFEVYNLEVQMQSQKQVNHSSTLELRELTPRDYVMGPVAH